ncbi:helix-turn-helix protein [Aliarcobacter thereius]|uniref:helix-turn-helix domain-containing protein n=1 Tax=Aliarcobacter thereius TaxID=544718 RepID=UPI000827A6CC|nr:helix-turn-helix transcriptional regulator [Aliarcobacter thereius]OCL85308.1 helix-turn-helix protein [Aliarcobacter thereius]OCL85720.1 helix-turn-helix protein [Aliarcobacter thereius]
MKEIKVTQISKDLNITHSAVSQWFSGKTKPSIGNATKMNKLYSIPYEAWEDIKSYIDDNITDTQMLVKSKK